MTSMYPRLKSALTISIVSHLALAMMIVGAQTPGQDNTVESRNTVIHLNSAPKTVQNKTLLSNTAADARQPSAPPTRIAPTEKVATPTVISAAEPKPKLSTRKNELFPNHQAKKLATTPSESTLTEINPAKNAFNSQLQNNTVITNPVYRKWKKPIYPRRSITKNQQGNVLVDAQIDVRGRVIDIEIHQSSGYPLLDRAAIKSVKHWIFEPVQRYGVNTNAMVRVPVRFVLAQK